VARRSAGQFYLCAAGCELAIGGARYLRQSFIPLHPLMLTGTVKFFDDTKGFGFIVADDNQEEIFVHQTGLIHEIQEGDRVQFTIKAGKKGPNAVDVTRIM
jgi:CspA family cold shock protein